MSDWTNVKDRLPDTDINVLLYDDRTGTITIGKRIEVYHVVGSERKFVKWMWELITYTTDSHYGVIHDECESDYFRFWHPLPELPK